MAAVAFDYVSPNYGAVTRSRSMKRLVAKQPEAGVPGGRCTGAVLPCWLNRGPTTMRSVSTWP